MTGSRRAFSLAEILIGMMFLTFALLGMLQMNRISNRGAMDTQYELLAQCLAQEPIEIFRHLGYAWLDGVLNKGATGLPAYPINQGLQDIPNDPQSGVEYPIDTVYLQRKIEVTRMDGDSGVNGMRVTVTIVPKEGGAAAVWLSRNQVRMEALIVEQ